MSRRVLGRNFNRLLYASAVSNVGDGMRLAAAPLLAAMLTDDPALVAGAVFFQQLPWLLLSLPIGAYVDRFDRHRVVIAVNCARGGLAGLLACALAADVATVPLLYVVLFAVGVAEVVADNAASALLPSVVSPADLPHANARLTAAFFVGNQFVGPPVGAWLFAIAAYLPFGLEAASFLLAAFLMSRARSLPRHTVEEREPGWLARDVAVGLRWLWRSGTVRLLALVLGAMNITFMMAFSIWVLYARDRLGLGAAGFGMLLTASAIGGVLATFVTGWLTDRLGAALLLRVGLLIETAVLATLGFTRSPWVAGATMIVFGMHASMWGVVVMTIRQRLVPQPLLGRVNSVYFLVTMSGAALGSLIGGFLARWHGLAAPFGIAAAANLILIMAVWRRLTPAALDVAERTTTSNG